MLLFAMVAFTACKKDDEGGKTDERLTGRWQMELIALGSSPSVTVPANRASFLTFGANGSVTLDLWNMESEDFDDWTKAPTENAKYTMSSNGQSITLMYDDDDTDKFTVKELTDTRLVVEGQIDGANVTMTFKKV